MLVVPSVVANILKPLILNYIRLLLKIVSEHSLFCAHLILSLNLDLEAPLVSLSRHHSPSSPLYTPPLSFSPVFYLPSGTTSLPLWT